MSEEKKKRGRKKKLDRIDRMCLYCSDMKEVLRNERKRKNGCSGNAG